MLDIGVAEFLGGLGGGGIGAASRAGAVGDDERALVGGQLGREFRLHGLEVHGAGDVARLVGIRAVRVEERDLFGGDGGFQFVDADVGIFAGVERDCANEDREE